MRYDAKIEPNATREQQKSGFGDYDADELILNRVLIPKMMRNEARLMKNRKIIF